MNDSIAQKLDNYILFKPVLKQGGIEYISVKPLDRQQVEYLLRSMPVNLTEIQGLTKDLNRWETV